MGDVPQTFIVLLGAPGAGKGTQAERLERDLGLPHIATGDLFRDALKKETELGRLAKSYMDKGQLVPDDVTVPMVRERLAQDDCERGAILDGFPRTVQQAEALDEVLAKRGSRVSLVPYIKVDTETLVARLGGRLTCRQCGAVYHALFNPPARDGVCDNCGGELYQREDDKPETQRRRIEVYLDETAPLIDYYGQRGLLVEIDGEGDVDTVYRALSAAIAGVTAQK